MTKDDVIRMAEAVGMHRDGDTWFSPSPDDYDVTTYDLEAFAKLVAAASASVEREACALVCDHYAHNEFDVASSLADAIRARVQK